MSRANVWVVVGALIAVVAAGSWAARGRAASRASAAPTAIAVEVDGRSRPPLTAAQLAERAPDGRYDGWSVWRLEALLPGAIGEGRYLEFERSDGKWAGFRIPPPASGRHALLAVSDGGPAVVLLAPLVGGDPIPTVIRKRCATSIARLRVQGAATASPLPRRPSGAGATAPRTVAADVSGVPGATPSPSVPVAPASLSVALDDGRSADWSLDDLRRVPHRDIPTERGDGSGWSVRDIVATLGGQGTRIGALASAQGQTLTISPADWADQTRTPMLRVNHRGLWKFDWVDATTQQRLPGGLRDVSRVTVLRD